MNHSAEYRAFLDDTDRNPDREATADDVRVIVAELQAFRDALLTKPKVIEGMNRDIEQFIAEARAEGLDV